MNHFPESFKERSSFEKIEQGLNGDENKIKE